MWLIRWVAAQFRTDSDENRDSADPPPGRRQLWLGILFFCLAGAGAMVFMQGAGLVDGGKYHTDLTQSPHWFAWHGDAFAADDLLVRYGNYNESPVQNAVYWVGSLLIDVVLLNKLVGIAVFALTAALFYALVSLLSGPRIGALAAAFTIIFPRAAYETAGGFSKAWAIGFVLLALYVLEARKWRVLLWAMPLAALAYPVAPVVMGAIIVVGLAIELPRSAREATAGLRYLIGGSALAILPLLYKYFTPPSFIGEMISTAQMKSMWETGQSSSVTIPFWKEALTYLDHPFFVYSAIIIMMLAYRRGLVWKRSWSALVIASVISFHVADMVVPRLYLPDRYSRFSMAVLLILWFAHNWKRAVDLLASQKLRRIVLAVLVVVAALSFSETFRPCQGKQDQGIWMDWTVYASLSEAIADLPGPVLVTGHPYDTAQVMVQARQPVLLINRMYHAWFNDYRQAIDQRNRNTFSALLSKQKDDVNALVDLYGVTHLIIRKELFDPERFKTRQFYRPEYNLLINELNDRPGPFILDPPPPDSVVYKDDNFSLVRLPLR